MSGTAIPGNPVVASSPAPTDAYVNELRQRVPGMAISVGSLDRITYARDASPEAFLERRAGVLPTPPGAVVWPRSTQDVVGIVTLAAQRQVPVVPFGAGSGVVQGLWPDAHA